MASIFLKNVTKHSGGGADMVNNDDMFKLIDLFFNQRNIMYMQAYNSYDKFIDDDLKNFLLGDNNTFYEKQTKDKTYVYKFVFSNIAYKRPMDDSETNVITPQDARTKRLMYAIKLVATVTQVQEIIDINTGKTEVRVIGKAEDEWPISRIPLMVNSRHCENITNPSSTKFECKYDPGTYFIISGSEMSSEKTLINTERMIENKPLVFTKKDSNVVLYSVQTNSRAYTKDIKQTVTIRMAKNGSLDLYVHLFNSEIPVFILIRALGIESDYDIISYVTLDKTDVDMINIINISLDNCKDDLGNKILTQEQAITYLSMKVKLSKRVKYNETDKDIKIQEKKLYIRHLLDTIFMPHIDNLSIHKGYYVCYMIHRLLQCYLKRIDTDDRDSLINKRIDLPGTLIFELFKQSYKKMLNECTRFFKKRNSDDENPLNIINQIKPNTIEQALKTGLLTGSWDKKKGVAQMLQRLTYKQSVSLLRRVNSPATDASTNKLTSPRHLHPTQIGFLCVTGDTMITLSDGQQKMVKYLGPDDIVRSINRNTFTIEDTKFTKYFTKMPLDLFKIIAQVIDKETGITKVITIKATGDHPFLSVTGEWVNASKLRVNDYVYSFINGKLDMAKIIIITDESPEIVYDFQTISDNHTFIANGFVVSNCYVETPEGHQVGLVKNLSVGGNITIMLPSQLSILKGMLSSFVVDMQDVAPHLLKKYTRVFLNGDIIGLTTEPRKVYNHFKTLKLNSVIDPFTSVVHEIRNDVECKDLYIYCDGGRCYRPILRVEDYKLVYTKEMANSITSDASKESNKTFITTWTDFMIKNPGVVEYIDQHEQYNAMIAMFPIDIENMRIRREKTSIDIVSKMGDISNFDIVNRYDDTQYVKYTHCEIHPSMHLGIVANGIPFCNSNQGPRNIYQFSQAKQAMCIYMTSYRHRLDISYVLYHPYRPIIYCRMNKYTNNDQLPSGENAVVAIACYTGFNQEDSIIFNQSSLDRGMFRTMNLSKLVTEIQKNQSTSQDDIFVKPEPESVVGMKHASYDKLNEHGYVPEETEIFKDDIVLGKISPIQPISGGESSDKKFKDSSKAYKYIIPGVVDRVWTKIYTSEGYEVRMVRIRSERKPHIGDKLCCYSPDHEVLTFDGWKNIKDITKNDRVASLHNGNTLIYVKPTDVQSYEYKGSMYRVENSVASLRVTPNHRMWVERDGKFSAEKAKDIYSKKYSFKKNVEEYSCNIMHKKFIFPSGDSVDLQSWIGFFGAWIAKGSIYPSEIRFPVRKCIMDVLEKTKISFTKISEESISVTDVNIVNYINDISKDCLSEEKCLPDWVWRLTTMQSALLVKSIIKCNNFYDKYGYATYFTTNKSLRDDIQKLCLHAGMCADFSMRNNPDCYSICIYHKGVNAQVNKNIKDLTGTCRFNFKGEYSENIYDDQDDIYEDYDGKVYCCSVPGDGVIYVRRENSDGQVKAVWCGNSTAGQKGIIGLTLAQADMPFTKDGISPDMIISPNAIPSRMTLGQIIECLISKVSAIRGHETDGSPFQDIDLEKVKDVLESLGFNRNGYEYLYNGFTGRKLKSQIFIGPTYYQRLKHMVSDKIHARARGPKTVLTKQAPEGRSRDGGHRFGEMERDSMIAHGVAKFLKERMMETADAYSTHVCLKCGLLAHRKVVVNSDNFPSNKDTYYCKACKNTTDISKIRIPYAFKLLIQEMMSMNIAPRIRVKQSKYI